MENALTWTHHSWIRLTVKAATSRVFTVPAEDMTLQKEWGKNQKISWRQYYIIFHFLIYLKEGGVIFHTKLWPLSLVSILCVCVCLCMQKQISFSACVCDGCLCMLTWVEGLCLGVGVCVLMCVCVCGCVCVLTALSGQRGVHASGAILDPTGQWVSTIANSAT